jgi:hypothetical protein
MHTRLPRRLLPWLYALALLIGQASAFAHSLTHAHDPALPDPVCEVCVAQAHLGGAAPASAFTLPVASERAPCVAPAAQPFRCACPQTARARAPPASI